MQNAYRVQQENEVQVEDEKVLEQEEEVTKKFVERKEQSRFCGKRKQETQEMKTNQDELRKPFSFIKITHSFSSLLVMQ